MSPPHRPFPLLRHGLPVAACAVLLAWSGAACGRRDIQSFTVKVDCMSDAVCGDILVGALTGVLGILEIHPDLARREVTFVYDSTQMAPKNLEYKVSLVGFATPAMAPHPGMRERLPAPCRCDDPAPPLHEPSG